MNIINQTTGSFQLREELKKWCEEKEVEQPALHKSNPHKYVTEVLFQWDCETGILYNSKGTYDTPSFRPEQWKNTPYTEEERNRLNKYVRTHILGTRKRAV